MTYLNVVEIESALVGLASKYPSLTHLITLPLFTAEGRQTHALLIGTGNGCPQTGVLLVGGTHAREWGSPDICINFAADLLEAYTGGSGLVYGGTSFTAADIVQIIERLDVIVYPCLNPDGSKYSHDVFDMWRKNRNPASSGGDAKKIGVDINRNYDFLWDYKTKFAKKAEDAGSLASDNPADDLFHGPAPFSEPESQNVRWLYEEYPQISWFMDIHSHGGDLLYSWGDDVNQTTTPDMNFTNAVWDGKRGVDKDVYGEYINGCDQAQVKAAAEAACAAIKGVRGEPYLAYQSFFLPALGLTYPTSGASDDWSFSRYFTGSASNKVRAFTMEFGASEGFFPTWAQMVPIIKDVDAGLVRFCLEALPTYTLPWWRCHLKKFYYDIWHRVFPPELWGPYGPWERVRRVIESIVIPIIRPIIKTFRNRSR
jgi:murein tripeptide amidase MpaA